MPPQPEDFASEPPESRNTLSAEFDSDQSAWVVPNDPTPVSPPRYRLAITLFVLTCLSTFFVQSAGTQVTENGETELAFFPKAGLIYASAVMGILLFHEMGHYLQARRNHVPASLPYFLPMPFSPFGTLGAVIVQGAERRNGRMVVAADRKQMFDIAVWGPLGGLIPAIPICFFGVWLSDGYVMVDENAILFGDPLLLTWIMEAVHGPKPEGAELLLNPLLMAGWVGLFVTGLNLIPIGQLDGGHLLYTLIGRKAHRVSIGLIIAAVAYMIIAREPSYAVLLALLLFFGPKHPPTADDTVPLGWPRVLLGWGTLALFPLLFTLTPIVVPE